MTRLNPPDYNDMTPAQREVHDAITSGPRGSIRGPFLAGITNPQMAMAGQKLGEYFRFHTSFGRDLAEIAVCVTGAHYKAEFEWWAHARMAHEAGVPEAVTDAIRDGATPDFSGCPDPDRSRAVYDVACALNLRHRLTDDEFAAARDALGEEGLVDVIGLCGYYALVSLTLNAYHVPTPDGSTAFS
ncbi:MAG: carboxymuconolactone decarboxylase family protein [Pseudomonadota bacterium]